jgi:hypothetical protein
VRTYLQLPDHGEFAGKFKSPCWAEVRGWPLSVRVRPSSLKHDCGRRTTSTAGRCPVNVHAKSRLTPETSADTPARGQGPGGACPERTRTIPCKVQPCNWRAISQGDRRSVTVTLDQPSCLVRHARGHNRSDSQADSARTRREWTRHAAVSLANQRPGQGLPQL